MLLSVFFAAVLLAADLALRFLSRQGKLRRELLGGWIRLERLKNRGVFGGVLKDHPRLACVLSCGALTAALILCGVTFFHGREVYRWGAALLCAGGLGNVSERLFRGCVTDYIRFPKLPDRRLRRLVWNLADFMLLAGALLLAVGCRNG